MRRNFLLRRKRARLFQVAISQNPFYPINAPATITLVPTGALAPFVVDIFEGSLPAGMSISNLTITGTPTTPATTNFSIRIWDQKQTLKIIPLEVTVV